MTRKIDVTELALRDGHQSLLATRMTMADMVDICGDIDAAGYWSVECWGGATFDACIRFLNEDPWERLRTFRKLLPNSRLQMLLRGQNLLGYRHYEDSVVDRFIDKSAENGMDVFRIFDALNDIRNLKRSLKAVKRTGKHAQGTISYTLSPLHTNERFIELAQQLCDLGCDSICIKDMAALLRPQAAYDLVKGIKKKCGEATRVHVHCHATTGVTMVSLMKAIEAGADVVDASISSLSLGPGHNPTEAVVEMLVDTPYTTRLDPVRLGRIKQHFAKVRPRYKEFESNFVGVETEIFQSQIPGGMISNMESQLRQQGAADKLEQVLAEVPRVRQDAGFPPLVTPSSQIVGTQAVMNVMFGRYKSIWAEFSDLVLGYYGETIGPRSPELLKAVREKVQKEPITCRPADLLKPEWDQLTSEAKALPGCSGSDEDVLTYAMFPKVAPGFFASRLAPPTPVPAATPDAAVVPASTAPSGGVVESVSNYRVTVEGHRYELKVERLPT